MKRRSFIKLGATASAFALMPFDVKSMLQSVENMAGCDFSGRRLVLINLAGGNDGLNTVIPLNQYDLYANLRPTIKVPETGVNGLVGLDGTLPSDQLIGLNPAMIGFKNIYDQGWLRIIQSVGYPKQNKSHFASTDLIMTGNDGNSLANGNLSGWIGRFMETHYDNELEEKYPLAIQIGSLVNSIGFHGVEEHGMAMNLTNQDPSGFYSVINGLGGEPPASIPNSDYGIELEHLIQTDKLANVYAESVSSSFDKGSNMVTYPDTDIADQLKTVAKLISGGLQSKIYMVRLSGFDTHALQVDDNEDVQGKHHRLLSELSDAVASFCNDLDGLGVGDDVVGLTYSEFGRKAKENGQGGTDHGEIAPMFVFGKGVKGGVSGTNPGLTEAKEENNHQVETVQFDYRSVLSSLLQNFMGAGDEIIDDAFFDHSNAKSFTTDPIESVLKATHVVDPSCQTNSVLNPIVHVEGNYSVSPNPLKDLLTIRSDEDIRSVFIEVYTASGRTAFSENVVFSNGMAVIDLGYLPKGVHVMSIAGDNGTKEQLKLVKK